MEWCIQGESRLAYCGALPERYHSSLRWYVLTALESDAPCGDNRYAKQLVLGHGHLREAPTRFGRKRMRTVQIDWHLYHAVQLLSRSYLVGNGVFLVMNFGARTGTFASRRTVGDAIRWPFRPSRYATEYLPSAWGAGS